MASGCWMQKIFVAEGCSRHESSHRERTEPSSARPCPGSVRRLAGPRPRPLSWSFVGKAALILWCVFRLAMLSRPVAAGLTIVS